MGRTSIREELLRKKKKKTNEEVVLNIIVQEFTWILTFAAGIYQLAGVILNCSCNTPPFPSIFILAIPWTLKVLFSMTWCQPTRHGLYFILSSPTCGLRSNLDVKCVIFSYRNWLEIIMKLFLINYWLFQNIKLLVGLNMWDMGGSFKVLNGR